MASVARPASAPVTPPTPPAASPPPGDAHGRMLEYAQEHLNRLQVMAKKGPHNVHLQAELKSKTLLLTNARTAYASGDPADLEKLCQLLLNAQVNLIKDQVHRMRADKKNVVSVKAMDHIAARGLGPTIDLETRQLVQALKDMEDGTVPVDPANFTPHLETLDRALNGYKETQGAKTKKHKGYTTKRSDFIENIVANVVTASMRLYLERVYRRLPKGQARWDKPFIPRLNADGTKMRDAKNKVLNRINYGGLLKELGLYESASAVYRLLLMGGDFNPFNSETAAALWMEITSGIVATGGTLLTAMLIRQKLETTSLGMSDMASKTTKEKFKARAANFLVRAGAAAIFGGLAGYISYSGIPPESRGADGSLWYATQRAALNGVVRLGLPDGIIAVMEAVKGNAYGHIDEEIDDHVVSAA